MKRYAVAMALVKSTLNGQTTRATVHVAEASSSSEALGLAVLQVANDHKDFLVGSYAVSLIDDTDTTAPAPGQEGGE